MLQLNSAHSKSQNHRLILILALVFLCGLSVSVQAVATNNYKISTGDYHTCAIDDNGVSCWGKDSSGQTTVPALSNPTQVSAGSNHTCAIDDNGVSCWGYNVFGQTTVPLLSNPTQISAGGAHTCAIDDNGVSCWGRNDLEQSTVPTLSNSTQITTGVLHTCALDDIGVQCWGYNDYGQTTVPTLSNPTQISAGGYHTCAIDDNGVSCWGKDDYGQTTVPTVHTLSNPTQIDAGGYHTCALDDNGVSCWGINDDGQTTVPTLSNPTQISAGVLHTCALDNTGMICWGNDDYGQISIPNLSFHIYGFIIFPDRNLVTSENQDTASIDIHLSATPTANVTLNFNLSDNTEGSLNKTSLTFTPINWGLAQRVTITGVNDNEVDGEELYYLEFVNTISDDLNYQGNTPNKITILNQDNNTIRNHQVSAGYEHTCAIDDNGVSCWGQNSLGQSTVPTLFNPTQISAGRLHTCALDYYGVNCWGNNSYGQTTIPLLSNPLQVVAGTDHTCAIDDNGVSCWGGNNYGQTTVPTLSNPTQIDAGYFHTCALDDIGVQCWGNNDHGQTTVPTLSNPTQISAGGTHTCTIDDNGVSCWGYDLYGQSTVPTLSNPTQITTGVLHTCAIDDNGVSCWGYNAYGQTTVPTLSNPMQISAGRNHTCAIDDNGVSCWGKDDYGQTTIPELSFKYLLLPEVIIYPSNHLFTSENGKSDSFSVFLRIQPTADVKISISSSNINEGIIDQSRLIFTTSNWNIPQTVTIYGVDDHKSDTDQTYQIITAPVVSDDSAYNGLYPLNATIVNRDNEQYRITAGGNHTCAIDDLGVQCWGYNNFNQTTVPAVLSPHQITAGSYHSCALDDNGVICWGDNSSGQTIVPVLSNPVSVAAGSLHTCAMDDNGIKCWGNNLYGQTTVPALTNPVQIATGAFHSCAIDNNDLIDLICWGNNSSGQINVPILNNPKQVVAGNYHTCALDNNGVTCWGNNTLGQLNVPFLNQPFVLTSGGSHTCALDINGMHCWGDNNSGQINVPTLSNPVLISAGSAHTCAFDINGMHCWGDNIYEQTTIPNLSLNDLQSGIIVTPTLGLMTSESGNSATINVYLQTPPTTDVTLHLSSSDTSEGVIDKTSLNFTTANWGIPQIITVSGVDDFDNDGNQSYLIITSSSVSNDNNFNGIKPANVSINNTDIGTPSLLCSTKGLINSTVEYDVNIGRQSQVSITTIGTVVVKNGVNVFYQAPVITLTPGFHAETGSQFSATAMSVSCASEALLRSSSTQLLLSSTEAEEQLTDSQISRIPEYLIAQWLTAAELPPSLQQLLADKNAIANEMQSDASGDIIVFSSQTGLVDNDTNDVSDIYIYHSPSESLSLISHTINNSSGNGSSTQARINGYGNYIIYRSEANNLDCSSKENHTDDNNAADIYLYDIAGRQTIRVSWEEDGSQTQHNASNPSIAGNEPYMVYDKGDNFQQQHIYGVDTTVDSLSAIKYSTDYNNFAELIDNSQPGISADGRYVAYLGRSKDENETCTQHILDRVTGISQVMLCPDQIAENPEQWFPFFDSKAENVLWQQIQ